MEKKKVAFWGINEQIWNDIVQLIDCKKIEISVILDSDEKKKGMLYGKKCKVISPEKQNILNLDVDYFIITSFSAYKDINNQLVDIGISKNKIQVFVTPALLSFYIGNLEIDFDFIDNVYFNPNKIIEILTEYNDLCEKYVKTSSNREYKWSNKGNLISHACGGIVNNHEYMYSNSKEALDYSMKHSFKIIECDIMRRSNGEIVLAHGMEEYWCGEQGDFSLMTFNELIEILKQYPDVSCLVDIKWESIGEYEIYINQIDEIIGNIATNDDNYKSIKNQIVMEVYNEETIQIAYNKNFNMILTSYRRSDCEVHMNTVCLCKKYGIEAIALGIDQRVFYSNRLKVLTDKGIRIFVYSTDSIEDYKKLKESGVTGIFTNYLTYKDIEEVEVNEQ